MQAIKRAMNDAPQATIKEAALVLFSGGQDSTTCLAWALERFDLVETIAFDYRQRHRIELDQRLIVLEEVRRRFPQWKEKLGDDHFIDMGVLGQISETSLTRDVALDHEEGRPAQHLRARAATFCSLPLPPRSRGATNIRHMVAGMCETDYSGYPDCRDNTLKALQVTLNLGMDRSFVLHTPLMWLDKAETWSLAKELGGDALVETILEHPHTCYESERGPMNAWGRGCGQCPACALRKRGYEVWKAARAPVRGPLPGAERIPDAGGSSDTAPARSGAGVRPAPPARRRRTGLRRWSPPASWALA